MLDSIIVTEIGDRIATSMCGSLLAQAGATVILVEPPVPGRSDKWCNRSAVAAGKWSVVADPEHDHEFIARLLACSDIIITSTDVSPLTYERHKHQIVCDITAFGGTGPLAGQPYSDTQIQALAGIADTTGDPAGAPTLVGFPVVEASAGIYAGVAVLAALHVRHQQGIGQDIEIALYDCAVNAIPTFLVFHFVGKSAQRMGNRHALVSPWNAYRACDGWTLICAATDEQWMRLCDIVGRPELGMAAEFRTNADRVVHRAEVDAIIQKWVGQISVDECIARLLASGVAGGPIATVKQLAGDDNLVHREMVVRLADPISGDTITIPGTPLKASLTPGIAPTAIPAPNQQRAKVDALLAATKPPSARRDIGKEILPYAGLRVLEIGQYTTAPLVSRQLATLGAEVFKIEPPNGDSSRGWPPDQDGQGYFFTLSNCGKRSLMLDLTNEQDKLAFRKLLVSADVLVENLKPGSLARLGFGHGALMEINPRLVYCGISGFGANSVYPGRPAFDTVVQAMSGIMDLTRANNMPTKAGMSAADIIGGEIALFAILAALEHRERTDDGQAIDLSMQDAAVWSTQFAWNIQPGADPAMSIKCRDGYVMIESNEAAFLSALTALDSRFKTGLGAAESYERAALVALATRAGITVTSVLNVSEVAASAQTVARNLIRYMQGSDGKKWPLLSTPIGLKAMPTISAYPIGLLGEGNNEILGDDTAPAAAAS